MYKVYVLVDRKLSKSQRMVQACHAVAEMVYYDIEFNGWHIEEWIKQDKTLVVLAADLERLDSSLPGGYGFKDSYFGGKVTAIAYPPMAENPFTGYPLA